MNIMCGVTTSFAPVLSRLHVINALELQLLIGELPTYLAGGIRLEPGAVIIDVGANVGAFSAYAYDQLAGDVTLLAFEPAPATYAVLDHNARELFNGTLTAFPYGLSDRETTADFTYFPHATTMSSTVRGSATVDAERRRIAGAVIAAIKHGDHGRWAARIPRPVVYAVLTTLLRKALRSSTTHQIRLRPLSATLTEHGITTVDLLKIDVEGAELDVLRGITDDHWPGIRQVVIEVERWDSCHREVSELLSAKGFTIHSHRDTLLEAADFGLIYATRTTG
jgi:FkbM family methyltransferase